MTDELVLPQSREEALQLRTELTNCIQAIQSQLGNRDMADSAGHRLSGIDYWQWRKKAQIALTIKLKQLRQVNQFVKELDTNKHAHNELKRIRSRCVQLLTLKVLRAVLAPADVTPEQRQNLIDEIDELLEGVDSYDQ